jgi:hypothetical protein
MSLDMMYTNLAEAYDLMKNTANNLQEFFFGLSTITSYPYDNGYWYGRPEYPNGLYLVYYHFSRIANTDLDVIRHWHTLNGLTPYHMKNTKVTYVINNGWMVEDTAVNAQFVQDHHPKFNLGQWQSLRDIVEDVARGKSNT